MSDTPEKSSSKKVAAKLFILQGGAKPLSSALSGRSPVNCLSECDFLPLEGDGQLPAILDQDVAFAQCFGWVLSDTVVDGPLSTH